MRFAAQCYRAHDPRWAFDPLSGDGAAGQGGRFNRRGQPALYLSLDLDTAVTEASQGFAKKLEPLTICSYTVDCEDIVDLRLASELADRSIRPSDLACAWMVERDAGVVPASWVIADTLHGSGVAGILVPSYVVGVTDGASNLVLWRWADDCHRVEVNDPNSRLPIDQASWPR